MIYADPLIGKDGNPVEGQYRLRQLPEVSGAMVVMDPWTGRVLAMVGGFSFDQSQFNRATQAYRQPGSSFKPIVYSSALDNGYTPSTVVVDAPIEIDQGQGAGVWRPENFSAGKYHGPTTLRNALRLSLNTVTVRLAQDIGMPLIGEYAKRFGVYDELPNYLSYALGAGETTVMRMVTAYSMFANGGRRVKPTLIDRIQDRYGHTIFKHDARECRGCDAPGGWKNQPEPQLVDRREQVLDAMTAYQITSMMEGVVQGGTAIAVKEVGKPIAGKTGTTNDEKDAWFIGFSPDIVVGIYIGYDKPRNLGRKRYRRSSGRADRARLHEARARRQAGDSVPGAGRHQADPGRSEDRHARRPGQTAARPSSKPSSRAPRRRIITRSSASPMPTAARSRRRRTPTAASCAPAPAGFTSAVQRAGVRVQENASIACEPIALCGARRYIPRSIDCNGGSAPQIREPMRAEVERLVEEIKQSVGLLRRHL